MEKRRAGGVLHTGCFTAFRIEGFRGIRRAKGCRSNFDMLGAEAVASEGGFYGFGVHTVDDIKSCITHGKE